MLVVAIGPVASRQVETRGLDRNAWTALVSTATARIESTSNAGQWQATGFDRTRHHDLLRWRGMAAGRNIVLVSLESTAAQYLGLYGASPDVMPNLSALAKSGIVFEHAYAVYPESIKGLFSVLCSAYPAFDSDVELYGGVPCRSIASMLSGAGYRTALFHSGRFMYLGMDGVIGGRGFATLADAGDIGGNHNSSFGVDEPATVARILEWIDRTPPMQPFFVMYLPIAGHHPYETPEPGPFPDRDEFGRYRNALRYGDESLGALRRGLVERGLDERTMWVVFGDHGEAFGQHDGNFGHTFFLYEENIHVPFLIAVPGIIPEPIRSSQVVSLIDTAPTVLDVAGVRVPREYQGRSMLLAEPRMARFFADYSLGFLGLRDGPVKFIYEIESGRSTMFDLAADPHERSDRTDAYAHRANWYRDDLRRWAASQKRRLTAVASHATP
jgi:arylsulfatase A-like enzyme